MNRNDKIANRYGFTDYATLVTCANLLRHMHGGLVRRNLTVLYNQQRYTVLATYTRKYITELHHGQQRR
jgi:hypothetical protein